jgi:hypothetical protein
MHLTGFFDILGTKALVAADRFTDLHALDFSGAVAVAAHQFPFARFAVFSDCVIVSVSAENVVGFLQVLETLWMNWLADAIWVRGGIDIGEINWVDYSLDATFRRYPNLSIARVYGRALVGAFEVEQTSGPGILPFATQRAAEHIESLSPNSTFPLATPVIRFCTDAQLERIANRYAHFLRDETPTLERKHIEATLRLISIVQKAKNAG